jgi:hypothetical protein
MVCGKKQTGKRDIGKNKYGALQQQAMQMGDVQYHVLMVFQRAVLHCFGTLG